MISVVRLSLTPVQFLVINELLLNVCLGDRNEFEEEISDLMIAMDKQGVSGLLNQLDQEGYSAPQLSFQFSNEDGIQITLGE